MLGYGGMYDQGQAANLFGQGTQATSQGYWVPDGSGGYNMVPHGTVAPTLTNYGTPDWTQMGGGMYGSQYGATGPSDAAPAVDTGAIMYSGRLGSGTQPQSAPAQPTNQYTNTMLGAGSQTMYGSQNAPQTMPAATPQGLDQSGLQTLMGYINQFQQPTQPIPTSGPSGTQYDQSLMNLVNGVFSGSSGINYNMGAPAPAAPAPTPQFSAPEGSQFAAGGGGANYRPMDPQSQLDSLGSQAGWTQSAEGNWTSPTAGILTSTAGNIVQPTQYSNGQNAASSNPLGGMLGTVGIPLPSGTGAGGTINIPTPTPAGPVTLPTPQIPAPPPSPWSQTSPAQPSPQMPVIQQGPAPTQQFESPQLPVWGGPDAGETGSYFNAVDALQNMGVNPQQISQFQNLQPQSAAAPAPAQPAFNFGGGAAPATQAPSTTATQLPGIPGQLPSGMNSSLLSLLGQLPQPPDLTITPPTVDATGGFSGQPGGAPIRWNPQNVINSQQGDQLLNQALANNARQAATGQDQARENMAARGFSTGSGALGDMNRSIDASRMMADTRAYTDIPLNVAKLNQDSIMQQLGANLQGQQNSISGYNAYSDMLKNQGALAAQGYGLGLSGYGTYQNALGNLLGLGLQGQGLDIQRYGQDLNAYNSQNNAANQYLQNYLNANQLALSGNNSLYNNWLGLGNLLNQTTATDNQFTSSLLNSLFGAI